MLSLDNVRKYLQRGVLVLALIVLLVSCAFDNNHENGLELRIVNGFETSKTITADSSITDGNSSIDILGLEISTADGTEVLYSNDNLAEDIVYLQDIVAGTYRFTVKGYISGGATPILVAESTEVHEVGNGSTLSLTLKDPVDGNISGFLFKVYAPYTGEYSHTADELILLYSGGTEAILSIADGTLSYIETKTDDDGTYWSYNVTDAGLAKIKAGKCMLTFKATDIEGNESVCSDAAMFFAALSYAGRFSMQKGSNTVATPIINQLKSPSIGDTFTFNGIDCVVVYDAGLEQDWGRYILCEKYDLNYYEPGLGTGNFEEDYDGKAWAFIDERNADESAIGSGRDNTDFMINAYPTDDYIWYYVNQHRSKTGKQWHVPSKDELAILYENKDLIGNFSTVQSNFYSSSNYCSSTESSGMNFYVQDFLSGQQWACVKDNPHNRVRCVLYATGDELNEKDIIQITCETKGAVIHYTVDGTEPTEESPVYTDVFEVEAPVTIKARAFKDGMRPSETVSYDVEKAGATEQLPVPEGIVSRNIPSGYSLMLFNYDVYPSGSIIHYENAHNSEGWAEAPVALYVDVGSININAYVSCEGYIDSDTVTLSQ